MFRRFSFVIFLLFGLIACQSDLVPTPTAAPQPTNTAVSTAIPPTQTPAPTPTHTAVPETIPLGAVIHNQVGKGVIRYDEPFVIGFNQPMDTKSTLRPLRFDPPVAGDFSWDESGGVLTFTPDETFAPDQAYLVLQAFALEPLDKAAKTENLGWNILTTAAPEVVNTRFLRDNMYVEDDTWHFDVLLEFNQQMDKQSVAEALTVEPAVPFTLHWLRDDDARLDEIGEVGDSALEAYVADRVLLVAVEAPFDFTQAYHFSMADTAVNHEDASMIESQALGAISLPRLDADLEDSPPEIRFNYRLDLEHLLKAFTVSPPIGPEWQARWEGDETILYLDPELKLPNDTAYEIEFQAGLLHANGELLTTPAPMSFRTPRIVTGMYPQSDPHGWYGVEPKINVEITFSRELDRDAVIAGFNIEPEVDGEFLWEGQQLIFQPENGYLQGYTWYTVSLDETITDLDGETVFSAPFSWRFQTGELHTDADFGVGRKTQVVDASGRRAVQYRSYQTEPISVTFGLYDLDDAQTINAWRGQTLDLQSLPQTATWTAVTDPREFEDYRYINPQEVIIPPDVPPGAYMMTTDAGTFHDELLIFLSQNTLAVKRAEQQITVWTTDIDSDVVGNLQVRIFGHDGQELANGRSDGDGLYQIELPVDANPAFVAVNKGDDVVMSLIAAPAHTPPATLIHIHTDRPIYRPGHTVYFKAQLRHNDDVAMEPLPENSSVIARIRDTKENVVQTFELDTNHFGSVHGEFVLADGAMLGEYLVEIEAPDGRIVSQPFKVEDYRKPGFEVFIETDASTYIIGDTVSVTVDTAYFFGEPVTNATVELQELVENGYGWWAPNGPIVGETDSNGRFTTMVEPRSGQIALEVTVDDGTHQSVNAVAEIRVHAVAEHLGLAVGSYRKKPDEPVTVQVTVDDVFGVPVLNRSVDLHLYRYDREEWNWVQVDEFSGQTETNGRFSFTFTPPELGYYRLQAGAEDRLGNNLTVDRRFSVYESDDDYYRWGRTRSAENLEISYDGAPIIPGETVQLSIESTFDGPALLTLERADVRWQERIELTSPFTVVEVPISEDDAPNVFATVFAWQTQDTSVLGEDSVPDSRLRVSTIELPVSTAHKTLHVEILPDQEQYAPGDETAVTLRVTNQQGDPVSAELSFAVVDEAIFSLSPDLSPSLLGTFYFNRPRQTTYSNAMYGGRRLWYYTNNDYGGMGGGGGDPAYELHQTRNDFKDTAVWFPVLHTDANGEVTVNFTLPDNITSWRMTARALTADTQVGQSALNVETWQPIIVRPALPRILTAGDELLLSAILHNNTDDDQAANVTLTVAGEHLTIDDAPAQEALIPANSTQVIGWSVTAVSPGTITLTLQAEHDGQLLDAVAMPLRIQPLAIPDVQVDVGQFADEFTTEMMWPEQASPQSSIQINLNRSIAGSMVQGLEYLTGYPYGCVEQTMTRALPNVVVARAFSQLGMTDPALLTDLQPLVQASVQRLYGFQHYDGGWGWWTHDASHDYQTAWVIFGLAKTAESGYEIDPAVIARGAEWLNSRLGGMDPRTRSFALYSLAISGHGNLPFTLATAQDLATLDSFSIAALALALDELGETAVAEALVDELIETAVGTQSGRVYWPGDNYDGKYNNKTMASTTRNTALVLSAITQIRPGHELEAAVVRYLMSQRKATGWGSTNETAFTILALTDHLLSAQNVDGQQETTYRVELNGQEVLTGTLTPEMLAMDVTIPAEQMVTGVNEIHIEHEGALYYQINQRIYRPQAEIDAAGDVEIVRMYRDALTDEVVTEVTPNQLVKVELQVTMPNDAAYIIVEDSLPGGLDPINENLDTASIVAEDNRPYWQRHGYNHKEIRDNQVSFFITEMDAATYTFAYYARATHVGDFMAMPTEVYAMYDATLWGRSATRPLTVTNE